MTDEEAALIYFGDCCKAVAEAATLLACVSRSRPRRKFAQYISSRCLRWALVAYRITFNLRNQP